MNDTFWLKVAAQSYESLRATYADMGGELPDFNALSEEHRTAWVKAIRVGVRATVTAGKKALSE